MAKRNETGGGRALFAGEECPCRALGLVQRRTAHRCRVVHGEHERLCRGELAHGCKRRGSTVLEQGGPSSCRRDCCDPQLGEAPKVDVADLNWCLSRGSRRHRKDCGRECGESKAFHAAPIQAVGLRSTPFALSFMRKPGRRLVASSGSRSRESQPICESGALATKRS